MTNESAADSEPFRTVEVTCPEKKIAISGTAQILPTKNLALALQGSFQTTPSNWVVEAAEINEFEERWSITVTAVCVDVVP